MERSVYGTIETGHQRPHGIEGSITLFYGSELWVLSEHDGGCGPNILPGGSEVAISVYGAPVVAWVPGRKLGSQTCES